MSENITAVAPYLQYDKAVPVIQEAAYSAELLIFLSICLVIVVVFGLLVLLVAARRRAR